MTSRYSVLCGLMALASASMTSCIQDEAPNAECDLLSVTVHSKNPEAEFYNLSDTTKTVTPSQNIITFIVKDGFDFKSLLFDFTVTPGASCKVVNSPDDSNGGTTSYLVQTKSEDGNWDRFYTIRFRAASSPTTFDFEEVSMYKDDGVDKYYQWLQDGDEQFWATGNSGYKLSRGSAKPEEYPTTICPGFTGQGVKLTTLSTGSFGGSVGMPIAAGNLFIGSFNATHALSDAMAATEFGRPYQLKPTAIRFMAKYEVGSVYKDKYGNVQQIVDRPDMYAVLYRNVDSNGQSIMLHGDDGKTNPAIVARAIMTEQYTNQLKPDQWTEINIPFTYLKDVDQDILIGCGYSIAIVFSSSFDGGNFAGAVGSALTVDELKLITEQ